MMCWRRCAACWASRFDIRNPNRARALIGAFCRGNPRYFHAADGSGYAFLLEQIKILTPLNPQVAARLTGSLTGYRRYAQPGMTPCARR